MDDSELHQAIGTLLERTKQTQATVDKIDRTTTKRLDAHAIDIEQLQKGRWYDKGFKAAIIGLGSYLGLSHFNLWPFGH